MTPEMNGIMAGMPLLEENTVANIDKLVSLLPKQDQERARDEITQAMTIDAEQRMKRKNKMDMLNQIENPTAREQAKRANYLGDIFRSILDISEDVADAEILEALLDDFPELEGDVINYLNDGNPQIFSSLMRKDRGAYQQNGMSNDESGATSDNSVPMSDETTSMSSSPIGTMTDESSMSDSLSEQKTDTTPLPNEK